MREREQEVGGEWRMCSDEYKALGWLGLKSDLLTVFGEESCGGNDGGEQVVERQLGSEGAGRELNSNGDKLIVGSRDGGEFAASTDGAAAAFRAKSVALVSSWRSGICLLRRAALQRCCGGGGRGGRGTTGKRGSSFGGLHGKADPEAAASACVAGFIVDALLFAPGGCMAVDDAGSEVATAAAADCDMDVLPKLFACRAARSLAVVDLVATISGCVMAVDPELPSLIANVVRMCPVVCVQLRNGAGLDNALRPRLVASLGVGRTGPEVPALREEGRPASRASVDDCCCGSVSRCISEVQGRRVRVSAAPRRFEFLKGPAEPVWLRTGMGTVSTCRGGPREEMVSNLGAGDALGRARGR
ncbi:hypothetical protein HPB50_014028 [Hyalomma asiaticum]|uniref:Uncharacterized protein n=1 Tax=Hyalomma asiaticum TaxID=266040 RepID=A0ACB7T794_HYAAI|nr:hypothetical protein HPB50_014028 [Hyalomma asiaticum]